MGQGQKGSLTGMKLPSSKVEDDLQPVYRVTQGGAKQPVRIRSK